VIDGTARPGLRRPASAGSSPCGRRRYGSSRRRAGLVYGRHTPRL